MTLRPNDCAAMKSLLALRCSDDVTVEEATAVDQHLRYCKSCREEYESHQASLAALQSAAGDWQPTGASQTLWTRLEPRLGPAGRRWYRPFARFSTGQLAAAAAVLLMITVYAEIPRRQQGVAVATVQAPRGQVELSQVEERKPARPDLIRPRLGMLVKPIDEELRQHLGLTTAEGAAVFHVLRGSLADRAGLKAGDIILSMDDVPVRDHDDLAQRFFAVKEGSSVRLALRRDGEQLEVRLRLGPSG